MPALEALFMLLGGLLAGCLALVVGGVGGMAQTRRAVLKLADRVEDLDQRITREVKTRAGQATQAARRGDPVVDQLAQAAQAGGGYQPSGPPTGSSILAEARRRGIVR
jgi:hypothetical protein